MNEINYPYHLIIPAIFSLLVLIVVFSFRKHILENKKWKWFWISAIIFFSIYFIIVGIATYSDIDTQIKLNQFDLNKDGFFSKEEMNDNTKKVMQNLIHDTGRNFSFIIGFIFSGIIATIVLIIGSFTEKFVKQKRRFKINTES